MFFKVSFYIGFLHSLGSCCSHAAAILFKIELCVRMGRMEKKAVTSGVCMWKQSRKEVKPARLRDISFHKPKTLARKFPAASETAQKNTITPRGMY